jgi:hypothetical protein
MNLTAEVRKKINERNCRGGRITSAQNATAIFDFENNFRPPGGFELRVRSYAKFYDDEYFPSIREVNVPGDVRENKISTLIYFGDYNETLNTTKYLLPAKKNLEKKD